MNLQAIKQTALLYLGYRSNHIDANTDRLLEQCIEEIPGLCHPAFIHQEYSLSHTPLKIDTLEISLDYPDLIDLFDSCNSCIIVGCTLGQQIDRHLKYLAKIDMTKMTIMDAVASSYLEAICDDYEQKLHLSKRTMRFCPGYGNVPITLNRSLANALQMPKLIGLTVLSSNILLPQKSMIGLIGIGNNNYKKHCFSCIKKDDCDFRKRGLRCYKTS